VHHFGMALGEAASTANVVLFIDPFRRAPQLMPTTDRHVRAHTPAFTAKVVARAPHGSGVGARDQTVSSYPRTGEQDHQQGLNRETRQSSSTASRAPGRGSERGIVRNTIDHRTLSGGLAARAGVAHPKDRRTAGDLLSRGWICPIWAVRLSAVRLPLWCLQDPGVWLAPRP
jgi:hypothetical protein